MKPGISIAESIRIQNALMAELIAACFGDKPKAIRLLEYERKRNPTLKTMAAIEVALDRLCHDRGGKLRPALAIDPSDGKLRSGRAASARQGPPDANFRMALSVLLACALIAGFIKIASKSLQAPVAPAIHSQSPIPPLAAPPPVTARESAPSRLGAEASEPRYSSGVFKCTVNGRTVYSDSACGTAVTMKRLALPDASAGFASPPRENLEDLTAKRVAAEQIYQRSVQAQATEIHASMRKTECQSLGNRIDWLDASARAPQPAQMQDWIRADKARTQARQFDLHC
jgi:hypothetical protein